MGTTVAGLAIRERRTSPRISIGRCLVRVRRCRWPLWTPTGAEYTARGLNLSFGGLAFRGRQPYRIGEHVQVSIQPMGDDAPAGESLTLKGRVVWSESSPAGRRESTGLRFAGNHDALRAHISAWAARVKHLLA